jgi:hypothetical protein
MAVSARLLYLRHAFLLYTFQSLQVLYSTWDPCNMTVHNPLILIRNVVMPRRRMDSQTQHRFSTFRSASNHGLGTRLPHSCSSARWRCNGVDQSWREKIKLNLSLQGLTREQNCQKSSVVALLTNLPNASEILPHDRPGANPLRFQLLCIALAK